MNKFELTSAQEDQIKHFKNNHDCLLTYVGAIGGKLEYCFTPTGLGIAVIVKCACGKEVNVTNYEDW